MAICPYVGGGVTPPGMVRRIALASNENALGASPVVLSALREAVHSPHLYPSGEAASLKAALADHFGLEPARLACGNGSEEILHLIARAFAGAGDEIIFPQYGFMLYKIAALSVQATPVAFPQPHLQTSVESILAHITPRTKIIFLDHPGNPLGTCLSKGELYRLHSQLPASVILVIDAAYAEYLEDTADYTDGIKLAQTAANIVVTRTFSKIYGLAGLRVGWAYGSSEIVQALNRIRPAFNVNSLAQQAGVLALKDQSWVRHCHDQVQHQRPWLENQIKSLGLIANLSKSSFILVEFPDKNLKNAANAYQFLGKKGIIVRPLTAYNLPHHLRITIGKENDMQELIHTLGRFMNG